LALISSAWADPQADQAKTARPDGQQQIGPMGNPAMRAAMAAAAAAAPKAKHPAYTEVLADAQTTEGFIKLHRKDTRLYGEISPMDLNRDLMVAIAIARGIGERPLLGGMTWGFGDDWVWQFRKVDDRIQIVRRNVRFRASGGVPQSAAIHMAYTDSILFSLPIVTEGPTGGLVVDLTPVFFSDLPQISNVLRGFMMAPDRSTWSQIKGFKDNIELEVAATYASGGAASLDTVADSRGVTLVIHYSISRLKETGYQPRLADDRLGYFLTVVKDFSKAGADDQFVRYINRWDLRKIEPAAKVSPPATPIIFWIEKTVPYRYRAAVRDGILEWNKAFEQAGFSNAIEVRQQPDDATWDPEDINYNTIRWITANAGFAMGPTHVNPMTGQILDSDIIFDADFVDGWTRTIELYSPGKTGPKSSAALDLDRYLHIAPQDPLRLPGDYAEQPREQAGQHDSPCQYAEGIAQQLAFGMMAVKAAGRKPTNEQLEKLICQGVKSVTVHEVGHSLGLRHNFKASTLLTMDELNDPEKTRNGLASSVMDYLPMNIAPKGKKQGEYFNHVIGAYDFWAIEYGYKPFPGGPEGEAGQLAKIASRGTEPALQYATDEDADGFAPDPLTNRFDLSSDPAEFARRRVELINQILPGIVEQAVEPGEGYQHVRRAFHTLMAEHARAMGFVTRYIGGSYEYRDHKGDPNARPPFVVVEAKKQRDALALLDREVFGPEAYQIPTKLYNYLAPSHWTHWGQHYEGRPDIAIHEMVLQWQDRVLGHLLSPITLSRLLDSEMKVPADQDVFQAAELLQGLTSAIFRETEKLQKGRFTNRTPAISSLRRSLQQAYFERLADLALGEANAPSDCQTVARAELEALETRLKQVLAGKAELDTYTRAHLNDLVARIRKVLDAAMELKVGGGRSSSQAIIIIHCDAAAATRR
jgi:hypothetical protein